MRRLQIAGDACRGDGAALVVSPHLDDAVLGCGCLLAGLARQREVIVATVFAGRPTRLVLTEWDRAAGFRASEDAIAARRIEDRRALAAIGARPLWLPFLDSQYGPSPRVATIAQALARLPELARAAAVLFPLGLFHSDHVIVRNAVLHLLRRRPGPARWLAYEDALYRRLPHLSAAALRRLRCVGAMPRAMSYASDADSVRRKARAVACYVSQLRALATPGRLGHADAFADEAYWALTPRRAATRAPRWT